MAEDSFLTTEEVLEYLQVNLRTVYRLIRLGKLPAVRVGRQWRFRRQDLDLWLRRNRGADGPAVTPPRPRILIVDDDESVREMLLRGLGEDYAAEGAADGTSAMAMMEAAEYDLVLVDLKMPEMDGLSLIRQIRAHDWDLPVVIITRHSTEASAIEAINLGVSGYLTKSFRLPRVRDLTVRAFGHSA